MSASVIQHFHVWLAAVFVCWLGFGPRSKAPREYQLPRLLAAWPRRSSPWRHWLRPAPYCRREEHAQGLVRLTPEAVRDGSSARGLVRRLCLAARPSHAWRGQLTVGSSCLSAALISGKFAGSRLRKACLVNRRMPGLSLSEYEGCIGGATAAGVALRAQCVNQHHRRTN